MMPAHVCVPARRFPAQCEWMIEEHEDAIGDAFHVLRGTSPTSTA
jgi:hypothetical protein